MSLYPGAEQVPWKPQDASGRATYYAGANQPAAVVIHRMQGWASTARQWAMEGFYSKSWHYTVGFDGRVMQHLLHRHGGYHAGIPGSAPRPRWPLWRGYGTNVNVYTIGVECEGFAGGDWPDAQLVALRDLCRWLAADLGIPFDRDHFPPHADIDLANRVNDFDTPERRDGIVYPFLFAEEENEMTDSERRLLLHLASIVAGPLSGAEFATADEALAAVGPLENPGDARLLEGLRLTQEKLSQLQAVVQGMRPGSADYEALGLALIKCGQGVQMLGRGV